MAVLTIAGVDIHRVEELRLPNHISRFTQDDALVETHRPWLSPWFMSEDGSFELVFQSFLFTLADRVVLVDPCTGNGRPHPIAPFDNLDVPFIERMAETGFRPQDVDFVVCTHLHHDHCGWNTHLRDGRWVPTFPRARYILQKREVDRWGTDAAHHPAMAYNDGIFERSVLPVLAAGLADVVDGRHPVADGLTVRPTPGHTAGHQMLDVEILAGSAPDTGNASILFTGDCFHHPIQLVQPSVHFGDVEDKRALEATRQALVSEAADRKAFIIAAHLPWPHAVEAGRGADGIIKLSAATARAHPQGTSNSH
jgi:glyoxylase-like metal-dependent hydrolase (beta-lactamase superfamily II)